MRTARVFLLVLLVLAGCETLRKPKADNPVAGTPPPRMNFHESEEVVQAAAENPLLPDPPEIRSAGITPVVLSQSPDAQSDFADGRTAALVNGAPILVSELLEPYKADLRRMREEFEKQAGQMLPSQREQAERQILDARRYLIQRDLKGHIERRLLVGALREQVKTEQIKMLNDMLEKEFERELQRTMQREGARTRVELDQKLQEQGMSIAGMRDMFIGERLAMEFLGFRARAKIEIGRPDLLRYYEQHLDDYAIPPKVKWQQLLISHRKHGGRSAAQAVLDKAQAELKAGADFGDVARKYSNGLNAEGGGNIGWTEPGSLSDKDVERALFNLPVGSVSEPFSDRNAFQIVRVTARQPASRVPFVKVQDEIRETIEKDQRQKMARKLIDELHERAVIVTMFDEAPDKPKSGVIHAGGS